MLMCKGTLVFNENAISLSNFIRLYEVSFVSMDNFKDETYAV